MSITTDNCPTSSFSSVTASYNSNGQVIKCDYDNGTYISTNTYDNEGRIASFDGVDITMYDENGYPTTDANGTTYVFNIKGEIVSASFAGGIANFIYTSNSELVSVVTQWDTACDGNSGETTTNYSPPCSYTFKIPEPIPTLTQWGLIILGICLSIFGIVALRKRLFCTI